MRAAFTELFNINSDASVRAKVQVLIGGMLIHHGATFGRGEFLRGVELAAMTGRQ